MNEERGLNPVLRHTDGRSPLPSYLIDARCLQDTLFAQRGIGRHARALMAHARTARTARLVGIVDRTLPPLADADRALFDDVRTTAYTGALRSACCFVQLSPMTHDPLFTARLLHHPAIPAATAVYDFIPLDTPAAYLPDAGAKVDYKIALHWLARYDAFLPISADAASRLQAVLHVAAHRITVTGAALGPAFAALTPGTARHVLVIGGSDRRKNPEHVIRAHARAPALQRAATPLVVTGDYPPDWLQAQRAIAAALGGDPALIAAPGHLPESGLLALYAEAACVVVPSRAEGFSLPVIEAMAAGVPVLASDIPAHRELLDDALFPLDDDAALAAMLDQVAAPGWRAAALARQAGVWPRFRAHAVAQRFWSTVDRLTPSTAPSQPQRRARVAMLTPLPPDQSGVADYAAASCAALGARVDLHVFTPTEAPSLPPGALSVEPLSALPFVSSRFDRVLGIVGNSTFHLGILLHLLRYGGASILHDGRLLDLYYFHRGIENTQRMAEAELGRALRQNELGAWIDGDLAPEALLLGELCDAAEPLMMHSRAGAGQVARRYGTTPSHVPFSLYRTLAEAELSPVARAQARERLGVAPGRVLIASFGAVHPSKAPPDCIWALEILRAGGIDAVLHFVGQLKMPRRAIDRLVDELGLAAQVWVPGGFVDEQTYRDYLVGSDLGVQLRTSGPGSISGALTDCIAAGLPTVGSAAIVHALNAPDYVVAVPDRPSPVLVADAMIKLLQDRGTTDGRRRRYLAGHGFDRYAADVCRVLGLS